MIEPIREPYASAGASTVPSDSLPPSTSAPSGTSGMAPPPRWGRQATLIQPRQPAFWLYLVLLLIGGWFFFGQQSLMSSLSTAYLLSWALVLIYAIPVAFVVYRLDLFEHEPKILVAAALIWGGVIATSLAAEANSAWLEVLGKLASPGFTAVWGKAIVGPGVEETLKLAGVVLIYLIASDEFDGPMDGFVYGAMVGLGFTVVEDVSYFINAVAAAPGAVDQAGPVFDTFIIRIVGGGLYGHVLFTGLTATGFAYLMTRPLASPLRRAGALACVLAGVAAHVTWNSPWMDSLLVTRDGGNPSTLQWIEYGAIKGLPFLLLLGLLVFFATKNEESNFRAIVAGEPDPNLITEPEIRSLRSLLARRNARNAGRVLHGAAGARLIGELQAAQIEYAMVRSRVGDVADPEVEHERRRIRGIKFALASLAPRSSHRAPADPAPADLSPPVEAAPPDGGGWSPTHIVPPGGMPAWFAPDPTHQPVVILPAQLEVAVQDWLGAWAHVRAANGWQGWVDGRLLISGR